MSPIEGVGGGRHGACIEKLRTVQGSRIPDVTGRSGGVAPGNPRVGAGGERDEDPADDPVP